jgi:hypothetical protein
MVVECSVCGSRFAIRDEIVLGRKGTARCKSCGAPISVDATTDSHPDSARATSRSGTLIAPSLNPNSVPRQPSEGKVVSVECRPAAGVRAYRPNQNAVVAQQPRENDKLRPFVRGGVPSAVPQSLGRVRLTKQPLVVRTRALQPATSVAAKDGPLAAIRSNAAYAMPDGAPELAPHLPQSGRIPIGKLRPPEFVSGEMPVSTERAAVRGSTGYSMCGGAPETVFAAPESSQCMDRAVLPARSSAPTLEVTDLHGEDARQVLLADWAFNNASSRAQHQGDSDSCTEAPFPAVRRGPPPLPRSQKAATPPPLPSRVSLPDEGADLRLQRPRPRLPFRVFLAVLPLFAGVLVAYYVNHQLQQHVAWWHAVNTMVAQLMQLIGRYLK